MFFRDLSIFCHSLIDKELASLGNITIVTFLGPVV
jgi:hypothetical protein